MTYLTMEYRDRARDDEGYRWYSNGVTWVREDGKRVLFPEQVIVLSVTQQATVGVTQ